MPDAIVSSLVGLLVLAAAVWIGGFATLIVVTRATTRTLAPDTRITFFTALGRSYGLVAGIALVVASAIGAVLLFSQPWTVLSTAIVVTGVVLVCATVVGVIQARGMTRNRRRSLADPDDCRLLRRVRRGALIAGALRGSIVLLSLVLLALSVAYGG